MTIGKLLEACFRPAEFSFREDSAEEECEAGVHNLSLCWLGTAAVDSPP